MLGDEAFVLRFTSDHSGERLLIINLGPELLLEIAPEPLLAPPPGVRWELLWSSEPVREIGDPVWRIPAESAVVVAPAASRQDAGVTLSW